VASDGFDSKAYPTAMFPYWTRGYCIV